MYKKICLTLAVTVLFSAGSANAFVEWLPDPNSSAWNDGANWAGGYVPDAAYGDDAVVEESNIYPIIDSPVPDVWSFTIAWDSLAGTVTIAPGGSITSQNWVILGKEASGNGTLIMTGGSLTAVTPIQVGGNGNGLVNFSGGTITAPDVLLGGTIFDESSTGFGTVNMTGGTINVNALAPGWKGSGVFTMSGGNITATSLTRISQTAGETGTLSMTGGTVTTGYLQLGYGGTGYLNLYNGLVAVTNPVGLEIGSFGVGYMDIYDGVFTIAGNASLSNIQNWIEGGYITAYGGSGTVMYDYDITNPGKTTVWAVQGGGVHPPPCTPDYPVGDFTEDCIVNFADFAAFAEHWLEAVFPQNYVAPKAGTPPVIDGSLTAGEWNNALAVEIVYPDIVTAPKDGTLVVGPAPTDALDSSETVYVTWDNTKLYIASRVYDPNSQWTAASPGPYNSQDVVQICFNLDNKWNAVFLQQAVIWDIVAETSDSAGADIYQHDPHSPFNKADVSVAGTLLGDGYIVEIAIPWSSIGAFYVPQVGDVHGFGLLLLDKDDGEITLMADFGNGVNVTNNPNKWNTLTLGN